MLSPRVLVRGNPARTKFTAENWKKILKTFWKLFELLSKIFVWFTSHYPKTPVSVAKNPICSKIPWLNIGWFLSVPGRWLTNRMFWWQVAQSRFHVDLNGILHRRIILWSSCLVRLLGRALDAGVTLDVTKLLFWATFAATWGTKLC